MSHKFSFTETDIRDLATAQSFERGEDYYYEGAVFGIVRRDNTITAQITGSQYDPYHVQITLQKGALRSTWCDCPYDWGGDCKHIVATLLTLLRDPDEIRQKPQFDDLLADLDEAQLQRLILIVLENHPEIDDLVERTVARL